MKIYYDVKKGKFVEQKTATKSASKIELSQEILDKNLIKDYLTVGTDHVYVSRVGGLKFAYVKQDEMLVPEYSNGYYRVVQGDFYYPYADEQFI